MKKIIIAIVVVILLAVGVYYFIKTSSDEVVITRDQNVASTTLPVGENKVEEVKGQSIIGKSVQGRDILAYHYGAGENEVLLVGGIHGGYEWNTVSLSYQISDYLKANPNVIPSDLKVTVIPVLNPDGLVKVVSTTTVNFSASEVNTSQSSLVAGRFNANNVDLNRNFGCDWKPTGVWQSRTVSGGSSAFSEPESQALKSYIESHNVKAVIAWYSAAGGVYSSSCGNGVSASTRDLTGIFAKASGYKAYADFDSYETTGDFTNWVSTKNIPAISILLTDHTSTEWTKNKAGLDAVLKSLSN